jgi:hypothetical protein
MYKDDFVVQSTQELTKEGNPMDEAQFYTLLGYIRSIRRLLIYILATLFGILCFGIGEFAHPAWGWLLIYPIIFFFIAVVEIQIARKKQRELEDKASTPPIQSTGETKR